MPAPFKLCIQGNIHDDDDDGDDSDDHSDSDDDDDDDDDDDVVDAYVVIFNAQVAKLHEGQVDTTRV